MSREIKFRAWDKDAKQWVDDVLLTCNKYAFIFQNHYKCEFVGEDRDIELSQYIGLKDKNGKEIYEGDIIKSHGSHPLEVYWMGLAWGVRWKDLCNDEESIICDDGGDMEMDENGLKHMEVIGNIYENQELLKG